MENFTLLATALYFELSANVVQVYNERRDFMYLSFFFITINDASAFMQN